MNVPVLEKTVIEQGGRFCWHVHPLDDYLKVLAHGEASDWPTAWMAAGRKRDELMAREAARLGMTLDF